MIDYFRIENNSRIFITSFFNNYTGLALFYHNLKHTIKVVERAREIASNCSIGTEDTFILSIAALFHDTGQLTGETYQHEERSIEIMKNFLNSILDEAVLKKAVDCICATKLPQDPKTLLEEIICDADTYHFGTPEFLRTDELLKREFENRKMSTEDWNEKTVKMLTKHKYFTAYCNKLLNKGKEENLFLIQHRLT